jgi:hypothetical protein
MPQMQVPECINYSELTDVIASVLLIAELIDDVSEQPLLWKWIILGAHSAIQGAMVCNLNGTSVTGALSDKSRAKVLKFLEHHEAGEEPPTEWLATFEDLLDRIQDPKRADEGVVWMQTEVQRSRMVSLHSLRNDFMHFKSMGWTIVADGLPEMIGTALECTEFLMLNSPSVSRHITTRQLRVLKSAILKVKRRLK